MAPARFGFVDHPGDPVRLVAERLDLTVDAGKRVDQDLAALGRILGGSKSLAVALARSLVLEQLADLGQREPGVVAQPADEPEPRDVGLVVQAVGALGTGGRLEESEFLVIADGTGRQADLGGDLLDAQETGVVRRPRLGRRHPQSLSKIDVYVKVRVAVTGGRNGSARRPGSGGSRSPDRCGSRSDWPGP